MTDRAVSETLGFVMVFAIVVSTIGVVYATGFSGLQSAKDAEQLTNMERAFDVLDDNLEDLERGGAPSRATEVKLAGGTVRSLDAIEFTVATNGTGCGGSCPSLNTTNTINPHPIGYVEGDTDEGDTEILYVAGAVLRRDGVGSVMLSAPEWITTPERVVIPHLLTYSGDKRAFSGRATVLIVAERRGDPDIDERVVTDAGTGLVVNVSINSTRVGAWKRFLEDEGFEITVYRPSDDLVHGEFETERATLVRTDITFKLRL